jgi:mannose-6-phosphate isomerase-like protein (cupin superfamily)
MPLVSIVYQCAQQAEAVAASLMPANLPIADPEMLAAGPCQEDAMTVENLRDCISPRLELGDGVDIADGVRVFPVDIRSSERTAPFKSTVFSVAAGQSTPPDRHDVAEMWVVLKGGGVLEYEGEAMRIAEQDRLFFPSQRLHKITNDSREPLQILSIYW